MEKFIQKAQAIFGDKYDYSQVIYINSKSKVQIKCKYHNEIFEKTPGNHINNNQGCMKCAVIQKSKTTQKFIQDAILSQGSIDFNYSQTIYKNRTTKISVFCNKHNQCIQLLPNSFLKSKAPHNKCIQIDTIESFIQQSNIVHNGKFDYSQCVYKGNKVKIQILCPIHGLFQTIPSIHLRGHDCKLCADDKQKTTLVQFIENSQKVHGMQYDYSQVIYINIHSKVIIKCSQQHVFKQTPYIHQSGSGCPMCSFHKTELKLYEHLKQELPQYEITTQKRFDFCRNPETNAHLPVDFYIPQLNTIVELMGDQHFQKVKIWKDFEGGLRRDSYKKRHILNNGMNLVYIYQPDVFYNRHSWDAKLKEVLDQLRDKSNITRCIEIGSIYQKTLDMYCYFRQILEINEE